jgi:hypothetical protein
VRAATGESFDYTYDAVGNRLTQTTITNTTVYTDGLGDALGSVWQVAHGSPVREAYSGRA